jgi:hypothetical protein
MQNPLGWKKILTAILVGLGTTTVAISTIEQPGKSTAIQPARLGHSIDRQPAITGAAAPTKTTPPDLRVIAANSTSTDRQPAAASTAPDRVKIAQAALEEAQVALALSQADVEQADINIQTFKTEYDRHQELHRRGAIDRQKLARAKKAYDFAHHQKSYAIHGLKQVKLQLAAAEIGVDKARSQSRSSDVCTRISARKSM